MSTSGVQNGVTQRGKGKEQDLNAPAKPAAHNGAQTAAGSPSSHWTLMVVFLSLLVDLLGFTVILPLIPSMLEYYSNKDQVKTFIMHGRRKMFGLGGGGGIFLYAVANLPAGLCTI